MARSMLNILSLGLVIQCSSWALGTVKLGPCGASRKDIRRAVKELQQQKRLTENLVYSIVYPEYQIQKYDTNDTTPAGSRSNSLIKAPEVAPSDDDLLLLNVDLIEVTKTLPQKVEQKTKFPLSTIYIVLLGKMQHFIHSQKDGWHQTKLEKSYRFLKNLLRHTIYCLSVPASHEQDFFRTRDKALMIKITETAVSYMLNDPNLLEIDSIDEWLLLLRQVKEARMHAEDEFVLPLADNMLITLTAAIAYENWLRTQFCLPAAVLEALGVGSFSPKNIESFRQDKLNSLGKKFGLFLIVYGDDVLRELGQHTLDEQTKQLYDNDNYRFIEAIAFPLLSFNPKTREEIKIKYLAAAKKFLEGEDHITIYGPKIDQARQACTQFEMKSGVITNEDIWTFVASLNDVFNDTLMMIDPTQVRTWLAKRRSST